MTAPSPPRDQIDVKLDVARRGGTPASFHLPGKGDARVGFGQGWVLIAGMLCLATVFLGIVWNTAPKSWRGWLVGLGGAAVAFFLLAPAAAVFTRRLYKKRRKGRSSP